MQAAGERAGRVCGVSGCERAARYECPRCALDYCSLECYRAHSEVCVEAFGRDADDSLRGVRASALDAKAVGAVLKREWRVERGVEFGDGKFGLTGEPGLRHWDDNGDEDEGDGEAEDANERKGDGKNAVVEEGVGVMLGRFMEHMGEEKSAALIQRLTGELERAAAETGDDVVSDTESLDEDDSAHSDFGSRLHEEHEEVGEERYHGQGFESGDDEGDELGMDRRQGLVDILEELVEDMDELDLSFEEALARLPKELAEDFQDKVRDGRISRLVPAWSPWWISEKPSDSDDGDGDSMGQNGTTERDRRLPELPRSDNLLVRVEIARKKASPLLMHNVVDVVCAYCLMMRFHNGDWRNDPITAARQLWEGSAVLSSDARPASMSDALTGATLGALRAGGVKGAAIEAVADASAVLGGRRDWTARALLDVQRALEGAAAITDDRVSRKLIRAGAQKTAFLLAWVMGQPDASFVSASRAAYSHSEHESSVHNQLEIARRAVELARAERRNLVEAV